MSDRDRHPSGNPFVGLRPFESQESLLFFGRRHQTVELLKRLHRTRFLPVIGSSGSGKSSLVRAGLIPKLEAGFLVEERDRWIIAKMKPGSAPLTSLAWALTQAGQSMANSREVASLAENIKREGLRAILRVLEQGVARDGANTLVLVDQFEELFRFSAGTQPSAPSPGAFDFVSLILDLARQRDLPVYVTITMRSDFLGDCDKFSGLAEAMNESQYLVPRLTRGQRREAILGPMQLFRATATPRLVDRLLNDAGDTTDQLPVLQHALMRTWSHWKGTGSRPLDLVDYEAIGTMDKALSKHAEEALENMPDEELELTRRLFQALTEIDGANRRIRRPVKLGDLTDVVSSSREKVLAVIRRFQADGRSFLTVSEGPAEGDTVVDISHESLIRQWDRLRRWVDDEAEAADVYRRLGATAVLHQEGKASLWRDPDLQIALDWRAQKRPGQPWATRYHPGFSLAMSFLDRSKERRDRERKLRRVRWLLGFAAVLCSAIVGVSYWWAGREKKEQRLLVHSSLIEKEGVVLGSLLTKPTEGLSYAIQATGQSASYFREATRPVAGALSNAVEVAREKNLVSAGDLSPGVFSISAQGHVVSRARKQAGGASCLRLWNADGRRAGEIDTAVEPVAISPDGDMVVGLTEPDVLEVWRRRRNQWDVKPLKGIDVASVTRPATALRREVLALGVGTNVELWDLDAAHRRAKVGIGEFVSSLALSPDGKLLAVGAGRSIRLFDGAQGKELRQLEGHQAMVHALAVSPSGKFLASGNGVAPIEALEARDRGEIRVWDLTTFRLLRTIPVRGNAVWSVAFTPGDRLLVAGVDRNVEIWGLDGRQVGVVLKGHADLVTALGITPDGQTIVSGSQDGSARFWDFPEEPHGWVLWHKKPVNWAVFGPGQGVVTALGPEHAEPSLTLWGIDGKLGPAPLKIAFLPLILAVQPRGDAIAAGGKDGIQLLDREGRTRSLIKGPEVWALDYTSDGLHLISGGADGQLRIWDNAGREIAAREAHKGKIWFLDISDDDRRIASAGADGSIRLWDLSLNPVGAPLLGHKGEATAVKFLPPLADTIATAGLDGTVRIWSLQGKQKAAFEAHKGPVYAIDVSHDGAFIVSGGADRMLRVWRRDGSLAAQFLGHDSAIYCVVLSPDGERLLTAGQDQSARLWPSRLWKGRNWQGLLGQACRRLRWHPVMLEPPSGVAMDACRTCQAYVWGNKVCPEETAELARDLWAPTVTRLREPDGSSMSR